MADMAYISRPVYCDIHKYELGNDSVFASYDLRTKTGQWANVCEEHRASHAATKDLGTGKGQRLIVGEPPARDRKAEAQAAAAAGDIDGFFEACGDGDPLDYL